MTIDTPVGPLTLVGRDGALIAAGFTADLGELLRPVHPELLSGTPTDPTPAAEAALAYFAGDLTAIDDVPVEQRPTGGFLDHAWQVLRAVPAGEPVTYPGYAALAGRPAATRAAALACARNAVALFVPCHRVVKTDGGMAGYRWGVQIKRWLLAHEAR
jgi:methylated-DNA-[protein]-cysteine S-methyltransferase